MELIYLWIEKYRNIEKQGFNFSPRFECEFDGKKLTIEEKKDYNNIFSKENNLNITAIVGENGSGKSSIFKLILLLFYCKNYDLTNNNPIYHDNIIETIQPFVNQEIFLVVRVNNNFKRISLKDFICKLIKEYPDTKEITVGVKRKLQQCNLNQYEEPTSKELKSFSIHFNYMLDTLYDGVQDKWIKEIYHKADSYETPLLLEPYKNNNDRQIIDLDLIEYLNNQNLLRFFSLMNGKKIFDFFNPNKIKLNLIVRNFDWLNMSDEEFDCLSKCKYLIAYKFFKLYNNDIFILLRENRQEVCKICIKIEELYESKNYKVINALYILLKVLESNKKLFDNKEYKKIYDWANKTDGSKTFFQMPNVNYKEIICKDAPNYEVRKIQTCINFMENSINEKTIFQNAIEKDILIDIASVKDIIEFIPPWVSVEFYENDKSIKSLSSGEKSFFTFVVNLLYQVKNINDKSKYDTINLFLDEIELGFHPDWQRNFLQKILKALDLIKINNKTINLYFATHSPFILSDIPKENIIFLKDGKNVSGEVDIDTFGANIHTLLSHGFFMGDGLMGEFAKEKINEVIKLLNQKKLTQNEIEECKNIISLIGEPIIKNQLQKMLDSHNIGYLSKDVYEEIELLKHRIEILRKNS